MAELSLQIVIEHDSKFQLQVDTSIPANQITAIYGPSGSGKTTLLHSIAGLKRGQGNSRVRHGDSTWQEGDYFLPAWQRAVGVVFQDARLFPHLDVRGNLLYGAKRRGSSGLTLDKVSQWLELEPLLKRSSQELSGGQRQRVAIGRALLSGAELLLMDEPLSGLDKKAAKRIINHLKLLHRETGITVLYVSHNIEEVAQLADQVLLLQDGQIEAQGPLLDLCTRLDTSLSREPQAGAILLGTVSNHLKDFDLTTIDVEGQTLHVGQVAAKPGTGYRLHIPARDVSVCRQRPVATSILNILPVKLADIQASGENRVLLKLQLQNQHILARITRKSLTDLELKQGDELYAQVKTVALLGDSGSHS